MKNEDTWKFANNLLGRLWLGGGAVLIVISAAAVLAVNASRPDMFSAVSGLAVIMDLVFMAASIIGVESALKKRFSNDGSRREDGSRE